MPASTDLTITREAFHKFRDFFYRKTGMFFDDSKRYFVDKRLINRMLATGATDFRSYFVLLRFQASGEELQALVNEMTVNETYFFREEYQFKCLVNSMLAERVAANAPSDTIRIWSVPCSSGEEAYSLAIYLLESWPLVDTYDVEIIASDIDTHMLGLARRGRYGQRAVQYLPKDLLQRYFSPMGPGDFQVCDALRQSVEFTQVNITDAAQTGAYGDFDVIFCRNLLIYFDDLSRRKAAEMFYDALRPGGFICLGHSESMSRISPIFDVRKFPDGIVYQKPAS